MMLNGRKYVIDSFFSVKSKNSNVFHTKYFLPVSLWFYLSVLFIVNVVLYMLNKLYTSSKGDTPI